MENLSPLSETQKTQKAKKIVFFSIAIIVIIFLVILLVGVFTQKNLLDGTKGNLFTCANDLDECNKQLQLSENMILDLKTIKEREYNHPSKGFSFAYDDNWVVREDNFSGKPDFLTQISYSLISNDGNQKASIIFGLEDPKGSGQENTVDLMMKDFLNTFGNEETEIQEIEIMGDKKIKAKKIEILDYQKEDQEANQNETEDEDGDETMKEDQEILDITTIAGVLSDNRIVEVSMVCDNNLREICNKELNHLLESLYIEMEEEEGVEDNNLENESENEEESMQEEGETDQAE